MSTLSIGGKTTDMTDQPGSGQPLAERLKGMTVAQQVAQLFMVGFEGPVPDEHFLRWVEAGVGGVIFFRENFQHLTHPSQVAQGVSELSQAIAEVALPPFLSVDQEGGRIERLPHWLFPSLPSPMALGESPDPVSLVNEVTGILASHLARLGFNMNFAPTLDVNLNPQNPIIGVRAYARQGPRVSRLVTGMLAAYKMYGVLAVGKHFPGHGNGGVDSHISLPELTFTEEELAPFQAAIDGHIPAMLVSHGFYPALQTAVDEQRQPASVSATVVQGLLRDRCGFDGLVISDDMTMGAVSAGRDAASAAVAALAAGVDVLIYKAATPDVWGVYEAVCEAVQSGLIPRARLEEALRHIAAAKSMIQPFRYREEAFVNWRSRANSAMALDIARRCLSELHAEESELLPLGATQPVLLLHPDRSAIHHYQPDTESSPGLPELLRQCGLLRLRDVRYQPAEPVDLAAVPADWTPEVVVFVSYDPQRHPGQVSAVENLQKRYPQAKWVVASASTPYDLTVLSGMDTHLGLYSYRPAAMGALAERLTGAVLSV